MSGGSTRPPSYLQNKGKAMMKSTKILGIYNKNQQKP